MKHFLLAAVLLIAGLEGYSQCEKKTILFASKTDRLKPDSTVERTNDGAVTIEFGKTTFNVTPRDESPLTGKVNSYICNWTSPYKVGKTQMKVTLTNSNGETHDISVTIEGKDGKVILWVTMDDRPDQKMRLVADKFEEKL